MKINAPSWKFKFWRIPHLDDLELFHGLNVTYDYPRHMHEVDSIGLILRGTDTTIHRRSSFTAGAGNILLIPAGEVHASRSAGTEYRIINIGPKTLNRIASETAGRDLEISWTFDSPVNDPALFRALLNLHRKLEQKISRLEQESIFVSTMVFLFERQNHGYPLLPPAGREAGYVKLAQDYLKSHYAENVSLDQLTSVTNLSPYYLLRVFHEQAGCPPHEYQTQLRVAHAKKLIRDGNSLLEAALETGFFDQSHFSRNFKRIVGVTPGQYLSESNIVQDAAR
jgi:AraC-like DNA-binding protein